MGAKDSFLGRLLSNSNRFSDEQIAQTIALFMEHALARQASAVHIEPHERTAAVRYRIGGQLHGLHVIPADALPAITSELKRRAELNPASIMPQEGSYRVVFRNSPVQVRISVMPVLGGEKVVIHLSPLDSQHASLESLGFWGENLHAISQALRHPQGLLLVASPKHAHRPDTLYGMLQLLHTPSASLATLEERVEKPLKGVTQTTPYDNTHEAFIEGIRALLRHDPNVIMVSNLPNKGAAEAVINAAHSGHLVLAGLYADNASMATLHISHLGIEPYLLATSLRLVVGQRAARKLCTACRERYTPMDSQLKRLEGAFGMTNASNRKRVHELEQDALAAGFGISLPLSSTPSRATHLWRANPDGCEQCYHTGYLGTVLFTEAMSQNEKLYHFIQSHPSSSELQAEAIKAGFIPMGLDGLVKALRGETTVTEVLRTVGSL